MADETPNIEPQVRAHDADDDRRKEWVEPEITELPVTASAGLAAGVPSADVLTYS